MCKRQMLCRLFVYSNVEFLWDSWFIHDSRKKAGNEEKQPGIQDKINWKIFKIESYSARFTANYFGSECYLCPLFNGMLS